MDLHLPSGNLQLLPFDHVKQLRSFAPDFTSLICILHFLLQVLLLLSAECCPVPRLISLSLSVSQYPTNPKLYYLFTIFGKVDQYPGLDKPRKNTKELLKALVVLLLCCFWLWPSKAKFLGLVDSEILSRFLCLFLVGPPKMCHPLCNEFLTKEKKSEGLQTLSSSLFATLWIVI